MNRRGFTLVELLIGMVLLALFGIAMTQTLMMTTRSTLRALRGLAISRTIVSTGALLREELGSSDTGEVRLLGSTAIAFGRTVGSASICEALGSVVRLPTSGWSGIRQPEAGRDDAVLLSDASTGRWSVVPIAATGSSRCPDGSDALQLSLGADAGAAAFVRIAEPVQLRAYLSGGSGWWGLAPGSGPSPIQPFAGPLNPSLPTLVLTSAGLVLPFRPMAGPDTVIRVPLGPPMTCAEAEMPDVPAWRLARDGAGPAAPAPGTRCTRSHCHHRPGPACGRRAPGRRRVVGGRERPRGSPGIAPGRYRGIGRWTAACLRLDRSIGRLALAGRGDPCRGADPAGGNGGATRPRGSVAWRPPTYPAAQPHTLRYCSGVGAPGPNVRAGWHRECYLGCRS